MDDSESQLLIYFSSMQTLGVLIEKDWSRGAQGIGERKQKRRYTHKEKSSG